MPVSYELVAIGCSWGGLRAMEHILGGLPESFPAAIVIAQHRRADSPRDAMVAILDGLGPLPLGEVEDKQPIEPGHVYLAPADYHVLVEPGHFSLSVEELVDHARPSVDVLFETAADSYGSGLLACILTGLNDDGSKALPLVKKRGGFVIVQHPDSAEKPEMPQAAIATGLVDRVVAMGDMAATITELVGATSQEAAR